jgi:hypothetical protein
LYRRLTFFDGITARLQSLILLVGAYASWNNSKAILDFELSHILSRLPDTTPVAASTLLWCERGLLICGAVR